MNKVKLSTETLQVLLGLANTGVSALGLRALTAENVEAMKEAQTAYEETVGEDVESDDTIKAVK